MKKILLVDVSSIFHRSYSVLNKRMPDAVDKNNIPCAGTYGFFTSIFRATREFGKFDEYLFALDVKGSTEIRKNISEDYKANRKKADNSFYLDKDNLIKKYLRMFGSMPLGLKGYEADDIIASSCRYISENYQEPYHIFIMSGDKDLEQCVKYTKNISFIKTQPRWFLSTYEDVIEKWGNVTPEDILLLMSIMGDGSDNIPGVKGYKLKKSLKVINDKNFLSENNFIIERNKSLIKLKDNLDAVPRPLSVELDNLIEIFDNLKAPSLMKRANKIFNTL